MRKNTITLTGFVSYGKKIGETATVASFGISVNTGTKENPVNKYVNLSLIAPKIDLVALTGKRVTIKGFFSGEEYKDKTFMKVIVMEATEFPEGRGSNEFELTMMVNLFETGPSKWLKPVGSISFNAGTKENPVYKYLNLNISPKRGIEFENKKVVTVKGFITGEFFKDQDGKDRSKVQFKVMEKVTDTEQPENSTPTEQPEARAEEIDEDEIPF